MKSGKAAGRRSLEGARSAQLWVMCSVPIALVILFSYVPMAGIVLAFKKYTAPLGIFGSQWVGLKNFSFFFLSNDALQVTWNTLSMNFLFIVFGTLCAVALALLFYEIRSRKALKVYQTIWITPNFLSWVVVSFMAYAFLEPKYGMLNVILRFFNVQGPNWYATPKAWPVILTVASVWKSVGMDCLIYYASLVGIDSELIEAAKIDGANRRAIIRYMILPHLLSLISILTIMKIGGIFRADFGLFYQLTRDTPQLYSVTDVIDTYIFRTMYQSANMGVSTAIGLLQSLVGFTLVLLTNHFSKKIDPDIGLF
ncbi:MAG: ABC transporter permease subunit [Firmicutes bacterium]|nr:ABC transporter permease subunit [Bacillota bacterium]